MALKQTEGKITALYERLSRDDELTGDTWYCSLDCRYESNRIMQAKRYQAKKQQNSEKTNVTNS